MGYAEFKGKSLPERYICKRSCVISCTGGLFYLRPWKNDFIHPWSFSIGYSNFLINCDYRYLEKGERRMMQIPRQWETLKCVALFDS